MVQIITDSSSLFTAKEEQETGVISIPLCISIGNKNFRDLEVPVDEFVADIQAGTIPVSSDHQYFHGGRPVRHLPDGLHGQGKR